LLDAPSAFFILLTSAIAAVIGPIREQRLTPPLSTGRVLKTMKRHGDQGPSAGPGALAKSESIAGACGQPIRYDRFQNIEL